MNNLHEPTAQNTPTRTCYLASALYIPPPNWVAQPNVIGIDAQKDRQRLKAIAARLGSTVTPAIDRRGIDVFSQRPPHRVPQHARLLPIVLITR